MKKAVSMLVTPILLMGLSVNCLAYDYEESTGTGITSYTDYFNSHEVSTRTEFLEIIDSMDLVDNDPNFVEISCSIDVDTMEGYILVDTVYEAVPETDLKGTKTGKASHEVYSDGGSLIYTVTAKGTFSYTSSSCSVISKEGSFTYPSGSFWRSTPTVSSGNSSVTKAYVKVSGTATCLGVLSKSYTLYLFCNNSGSLTSSYSGS